LPALRAIAIRMQRLSGEPQTPTSEARQQSTEREQTSKVQGIDPMRHVHKLCATYLILLSSSLLFAGCAVGPNFKKPTAPNVAGYLPTQPSTTTNVPNVSGGEAQQFVQNRDISGDWWTLFHSTPLNDLIERALKANPNLKAAQAALVVARENMLAQRGSYYPTVSAGFTASRQKTSALIAPVPNANVFNFSLYTPQVSVSFVPDVFGLNHRTVESLQAQEQQARFALAATHITLSSNVAAAAIQEASLRGQIDATRQLIAINTAMLQILREQYAQGYVAQLEVAAQESQLAQVAASLPPLLKQLTQQRDLLMELSGGFPSEELSAEFEFSSLQLPQELPMSLPSQLVQQRPDVLQAEENLHAASAQVGIAIANRLPSFNLTADAGSMALAFSQIFGAGTGFWDLAAGVTQPIFDAGTLRHRERAAQAGLTQAEEQYRSVVLTAFQNVADTLNALQLDGEALKAAAAAEEAAGITLTQTKNQVEAGYISYLALLSAEQAYQQAAMALVQAQSNRYADTAALFQALGGGWWNRTEIPKS
jgi:NodT family efflux transporter outer membrane factor (OMF) lipoprotein